MISRRAGRIPTSERIAEYLAWGWHCIRYAFAEPVLRHWPVRRCPSDYRSHRTTESRSGHWQSATPVSAGRSNGPPVRHFLSSMDSRDLWSSDYTFHRYRNFEWQVLALPNSPFDPLKLPDGLDSILSRIAEPCFLQKIVCQISLSSKAIFCKL